MLKELWTKRYRVTLVKADIYIGHDNSDTTTQSRGRMK